MLRPVAEVLAATTLVLSLATASHAADPPGLIIARSQTATLTPQTVDAVARLAEPTRLQPVDWPAAATLSAQAVILGLCGSIQPGYIEALKRENGLQELDLAAPLGDQVFKLSWPSCIRVDPNRQERVVFTTRAGDTPLGIARLLAGAATSQKAAGEMLAKLGLASRRALTRPLQADLGVIPTFIAPPSLLIPRNGDGEALRKNLLAVAGSDVTANNPDQPGTILTGRLTSDPVSPCIPHEVPVPAKAIADAFDLSRVWIRENRGEGPGEVRILVIDNGFFGVRCDDGGDCPMLDGLSRPIMNEARFPRLLFDIAGNRAGSLGINVGTGLAAIRPINYLNGLARPANTDVVAGHGTHVAGLALGGPAFLQHRAAFHTDGGSWLKLVNLNIAKGARTFHTDTLTLAFDSVGDVPQGMRIVNLSIGFDANQDKLIERLGKIVAGTPALKSSLLVMAAGNGGPHAAATRVWPAALASESSDNLIAVASIDGDGQISDFSSHGATHVTMAAPGCAIRSWLSAESGEVAVNGTSQAAPLVSFAAALVHAVLKWDHARLRDRLILSGQLIADPTERAKTIFGTELDIVRAVLVHHDVMTLRARPAGPPTPDAAALPPVTPRVLIGTLQSIGIVRCNGIAVSRHTLASIKRGPDGLHLFQRIGRLEKPCRAELPLTLNQGQSPVANDGVRFAATHELTAGGLIPLASTEHVEIAIDEMDRLIDLTTTEAR